MWHDFLTNKRTKNWLVNKRWSYQRYQISNSCEAMVRT